MDADPDFNLKDILSHFQLEGNFLGIQPFGSGLINKTYLSRYRVGRIEKHYIHQWINHHVFKEPVMVMENIERVTRHVRIQVLRAGGDPLRETLNLVPSLDGRPYYRSPEGNYWRTYLSIEGARTYDQVEDINQVYNASRAFGKFQKMLSNLPGERLHETIPDFHHTQKRFETFLSAVDVDAAHHAKSVKAEIDFVLQREDEVSVILEALRRGVLPERVTHNDTKLNNVMIDDRTGEGICVIDLDTVMPGCVLYDFGDSVRIGACSAAEDERDLEKVHFDLRLFDNLARGYLDATRTFLTPLEIDHMAFSARLITLEQAIRFLTDHLNGDIYYKISRPNHNLDRCRTQLKMLVEMEQEMVSMEAIINRYR
jgi:Ser/Thr protein kinase RdoA (MazF antagonist)